MGERSRQTILPVHLAVFVGIPLLMWVMEGFPPRTLLKDALSVVTLLAFSLIVGLFYLSRARPAAKPGRLLGGAIRQHKRIGYLVLAVLLPHPFLLVVPRFFEAGVAPEEALFTVLTTLHTRGVVLGLGAWGLLLAIGLSSLARRKLRLPYRAWRALHGGLALLCLTSATFHVLDLGRHTDGVLGILFVSLAAGGMGLLLDTYLPDNR